MILSTPQRRSGPLESGWRAGYHRQMFSRLGKTLDILESRLSLYILLGGTGVSFGIPAWAAHATQWLANYGPIGWVVAGFAGSLVFLSCAFIIVLIAEKAANARMRSKLNSWAGGVYPLDTHFVGKRIFLQSFIPPGGDAVVGKFFHRCEIVGPLNIVPFRCSIQKSLYVKADYILVNREVLRIGTISNAHTFIDCQFVECKFYFVSFLINDSEFETFDKMGGCNWITRTPRSAGQQLALADTAIKPDGS